MLRSNRIIALDIGASKLVVAEFVTAGGVPQLVNYGIGRLGIEPDSQADPSPYIVATIREILQERGIRPAPLFMTVSGQAVFPRYVRLPAVARDKVLQIIQYEAEQNVPFPIEEVVWDYQLLGDSHGDELKVMLVAVKLENVSRLTDCVLAAGLEPEIVDAAPMALYNAARFNYPRLEGCTMLLDIGARSSNLIFIEGDQIFSRSIPVAGNAITLEVAKEFDVPFAQAEAMKIKHASVALGGVHAGPEDEAADRVSKIVRNVVTRLHAEVNRSINFYRSQQGGSVPARVLLTGGSSVIPNMDTFFREKLKIEVDYLNPFVNLPVGERIEAERVGRDLHLLGEVSGLALRRSLACPVEMNLLPPALRAKKIFQRRQPFFAAAAVGLVLIMLCWWVYAHRMSQIRGVQSSTLKERHDALKTVDADLKKVKDQEQGVVASADSLLEVIKLRSQWMEMLRAIGDCLMEGMWLTSLKPTVAPDGAIRELELQGAAFTDKLPKWQGGAAGGSGDAFEAFVTRFRHTPWFSDDTALTHLPPVPPGDYKQSFTLKLVLEEPLKIR